MNYRAFSLVLILVLVTSVSLGQNISSSVKGVLVDPSGAVISGAACSLVNQATSASLTTKSDDSGVCTFLNVLAATYTLRVTAPGFQPLELKDINVTANEVRALGNVKLTVGALKEAVTVMAEPTPIQLVSAEKAGTVTSQQLDRLALKGRDFFGLMTTIPGVVDTTVGREMTRPESVAGTSINGNRDSSKNFTVDGVTTLDTGSNQTVHFQPNMDSIGEVKILTSNYQAEFGRSSGGMVTVITRGGSRDFHGAAYDYYRHETLNAASWANKHSGLCAPGMDRSTCKPPYRYRITGYNLGGPIYIPNKFNANREKFFFFWSQEYTGTRLPSALYLRTVPTERERNGDFSQSRDASGNPVVVKDPLTGLQFANNVIPPNRINSVGQAILNFFPTPNYTDPNPNYLYARNYRSEFSGQYNRRSDVLRIDANLTPTVSLYYRFAQDADKQELLNNWLSGINWLLTPMIFEQPGYGHAVHFTKLFSPTFINEFNFGISHNKLSGAPKDPSLVTRAKVANIPEWYADSADFLPNFSFGSVYPPNPVNFSYAAPFPYRNTNDIYSFTDGISKSWREHNFKAGVYFERTGKLSPVWLTPRGSFNFTRSTLNPFDSNHGFANALLGNFYSYTESNKRLDGDWWFSNIEWYLQDNWRIGQRLTLDLGVRLYHLSTVSDNNHVMVTFDPRLWSASQVPVMYGPAINPATGKRAGYDPTSGTYVSTALIGFFVPNTGNVANGMGVAGVGGYPHSLATSPWLTVGPRVGFAWDMFGTGNTALRGGFGMFYDRTSILPNVYASGGPPVAFTPTLYFGNLSTFTQTQGLLAPPGLTAFYGEAKAPQIMNYSLGIQHLISNTAIDVSYVGALSRHLWVNKNVNPAPIGAHFDAKNLDPTTGASLPENFLRPYLGFGDIISQQYTGTSNYNALQVKVEHRYKNGLQFGVAYTWSRALGVESTEYDYLSPFFDPRQWNYGPLSFDRTHSLVINYSYDLPKPGKKYDIKPLGWFLDNWTLSGITSFISGAPYMPTFGTTDGQDITGTAAEGARVTVVGDASAGPHGINPAAFARTPKGSFGNARLGMLPGPGMNNWDIAIAKRVPLFSEQRYVQFRTEMFNVFNHTQYNALDTFLYFNPAGTQISKTVGDYTGARPSRVIELSARIVF